MSALDDIAVWRVFTGLQWRYAIVHVPSGTYIEAAPALLFYEREEDARAALSAMKAQPSESEASRS